MINTNTPEFKRAAAAHAILVGSRAFNLPLRREVLGFAEKIKLSCDATTDTVMGLTSEIVRAASTGVELSGLLEKIESEAPSHYPRFKRNDRRCYYEKFKKSGINYR